MLRPDLLATIKALDQLARALLGKRVACGVPSDGDGTWAEYLVTSADRCMPLLKETSTEQGATLIINPLTASAD